MEITKRIEVFDFIKGSLILFVIWGHFCMYLSGQDYEKNLLTTYIRLFQMPLFIFISGYFQKPVVELSSAIKKLKKSLMHVGVPMCSWILIVYVFKLVLNSNKYFSFKLLIEQTHGIVSLFWYLGCLLMCLFIYTLVSLSYYYNKKIGITFLSASIVMSITVNSTTFYFPFLWVFFVGGVIYKRIDMDKIMYNIPKQIKYIVFVVLFTIVMVCGWIYKTSWTFYNTDNCIFTADSYWKSEMIFIIYRYFIYIMYILFFHSIKETLF